MRRFLKSAIALLAAVALISVPNVPVGVANEPPPGDGPGPGKEPWVSKPLFDSGNPAARRLKPCRVLLQGPYTHPRTGKNRAHGRLECTNKNYLHLGRIQLWLHREDNRSGTDSRLKTCTLDSHTTRVVKGVRWHGCSVTVALPDDRGFTTWVARFKTAQVSGHDGRDTAVVYEPVSFKCRTTATKWCKKHPRKVAMHRATL